MRARLIALLSGSRGIDRVIRWTVMLTVCEIAASYIALFFYVITLIALHGFAPLSDWNWPSVLILTPLFAPNDLYLFLLRDHHANPQLALSFPVALAVLLFAFLKFLKERPPGLCPTCSYDLRASKDRCPECGTPIAAQQPPI